MAPQHPLTLEQVFRQFLRADIALGQTYRSLANTAYWYGHREHGDALVRRATMMAALNGWPTNSLPATVK